MQVKLVPMHSQSLSFLNNSQMLLACSQLFRSIASTDQHADSKEDAAPVSADAQAYTSGSKQAPMPTYFIGSFGAGSKEAMLSLSTASSNIQYLGTSGLKTLQGLNVAFLDGIYNAAAYKQDAQDVGSAAGCRHYTQVNRSNPKPELVSIPYWRSSLLLQQGWLHSLSQAAKLV